jgi:hypothetical protein
LAKADTQSLVLGGWADLEQCLMNVHMVMGTKVWHVYRLCIMLLC